MAAPLKRSLSEEKIFEITTAQEEADVSWISLMNNKAIYGEFVTKLLEDTDYKFLGAAYVAGEYETYIADERHDLDIIKSAP